MFDLCEYVSYSNNFKQANEHILASAAIVWGTMPRLLIKLVIWQSKIREKRLVFFCGFRLFINKRANRSHAILQIEVFLQWLFMKSKDLSVLFDLPLRLMEKDSFGSLELGDEAHPREVSSRSFAGRSKGQQGRRAGCSVFP